MDLGPATQESAEPPTSDTLLPDKVTATSGRNDREARPRIPGNWPLTVVLVTQTLLSARLIRADTAFEDEATYLWAGHLEWANLLHGTSLPPFPAYFSGAPVIYPPIGAVADSLGGLTGARVLSLVFMLGATVALWSVTSQLHGRRAAFFACALFAVLGPTLHLGAFATYDAMSLFLVTLAAWLVVQAGDRQDATVWMLAAAVTLAVANATSYPSALFDPVVILLAWVVALPKPGGKAAAARALALLAMVALLITLGLLIGGSRYIHGVQITTLTRAASSDSVSSVLTGSWTWTGVIIVAAVCGVIISWVSRPGHPQTWLLTLAAAAILLVPADQASLHTTASLDKHVDLGAWFAAIAAGYAIDKFAAASPTGNMRTVTVGACVVALCFPVSLGAGQSWVFSTSWPNSSDFLAILRPLADGSSGHLLVEDPSVAEYYLPSGTQWMRWSSTRNIIRPGGAPTGGPSSKAGIVGDGDAGTYAEYIANNYFSLVALSFSDTTALDHDINADLAHNHRYRVIEIVPYGVGPTGPTVGTYKIWELEPPS
jgi:hypothetical protein